VSFISSTGLNPGARAINQPHHLELPDLARRKLAEVESRRSAAGRLRDSGSPANSSVRRYGDTKAAPPIYGVAGSCSAVNQLSKSVVRQIRMLRSVGAGGGQLPPPTPWMWKRSHGGTTKAPPDERGGNRYVLSNATAPHLYQKRRFGRQSITSGLPPQADHFRAGPYFALGPEAVVGYRSEFRLRHWKQGEQFLLPRVAATGAGLAIESLG
jgi:hypothetical protein